MATAKSFLLLVVFSTSIAQDVKVIYKSDSKPVRLFTEEELRKYDGSEVRFLSEYKETRLIC